jgi:hypothetical protein
MKHKILPLSALCSLAVLASSTEESGTITGPAPAIAAEREAIGADQELSRRMRSQQEIISRRLGISAPLDAAETTDPATGIDAIQELYDSGFIVPATLEEVEAALEAAAQTPEPEDDQAALILKHRGSYRFFLNQASK